MRVRGDDGQEYSQNRKESTPEDSRQGQTLPLRQVPQAKPETCENPGTMVLPKLPETE
jgi:hypothetical protein